MGDATAVLLTGAAGFIGSHVAEALVATGRRVVGLDNLDPYYDVAIKRGNLADLARLDAFHFIEGDIRDADTVARAFSEFGVDEVIHLAAMAGVRPSIERPSLYQDVNVTGTTVLLEHARQAQAKAFVMASSSSVYGRRNDPPFRESDPPAVAQSPYAASKQASECVGRSFTALHGLDVTALRFFNAYGPRQRPDMAIHKFTKLMLAGKPIPLYGDGSSRRDHTYIGDIVEGVVQSLEHAPGKGYRVYNLGNSATTSLAELVSALETVWNVEAIIDRKPDQPGDVPLTCADVSRAGEELGFAPKVDLTTGLAQFAAWYREAFDL